MKKLLLVIILFFSFISISFSDWKLSATNIDGTKFYLDLENIKYNNGYLYIWTLSDYIKPSPNGILSYSSLEELDCKIPRKLRQLSGIAHKTPMGRDNDSVDNKTREWRYPKPNSIGTSLMEVACTYKK
jgi:hypothetical protein